MKKFYLVVLMLFVFITGLFAKHAHKIPVAEKMYEPATLPPPVDLAAVLLVSPSLTGCRTATETVTVRVINYGPGAIDFSADNVTVNVSATGPNTYAASRVLNSGTLGSGSTLDVTMLTTFDMTLTGTYTFNANTVLVGDANTSNDAMTAATRYNIPMSGTYTVGAAGNYATLTAAVQAYNSVNCVSGNIVFLLTDAVYSGSETFPLTINSAAAAASGFTLTIKPGTGVNATVSGAASNNALIRILNSNVTIDGSNNGTGSRNLTFTNTGTTAPTVMLVGSVGTSPITNTSIKNSTVINGVNTSSAVVVSDAATLGNAGYFTNIYIANNSIQKAYIGIYSIAAVNSGNGNGLNISSNDLTASGANAIRLVGIYVQGADGATVENNTIGNFDGTSAEDDKGIWFALGTSNSKALKNKISNLHYTGTGGYGAHGIYISTGNASANILAANNMISNLSGDGFSYTGSFVLDNPIGIVLTSTQSGINLYNNSINLTGNTLNQTNAMSMGIYLGSGSVANIRDNIIVNNLGRSGATGYGAVGIYAVTGNTQFTAIDYNDYFVNPTGGGNKFIGQIAAAGSATIAAWRTATAQDVNSLNIQPAFVSSTDLHLTADNCPLDNKGTPIAGITDDFDADIRSLTIPDMGADEFTANNGGTLAGNLVAAVCSNKAVVSTGTTYTDASCNLIATVLPSGADPVTGLINVCVTRDAVQMYHNGEPYVQRHYDIEPATANISTTSATITLYFTDAEFVQYNTNNPVYPKLPTVAGGGNADPFRVNLKVTQFHGTSTSTPTAPGWYTGVAVLKTPSPSNIVWNGAYWAITFNITGFSGFYVHTRLFGGGPLPISLNYFNGTKQGSHHLLNWKVTCNSTPRATMILERSADSRNFMGINSITADAARCNQPFDYTDTDPLKGMNYYRLKMIDADGKISYSGMVALLNAVKGFDIISIAPNPVINDHFKLNVSSAQASKMDIIIFDMQGRLVNRQTVQLIAGFNSLPIQAGRLAAGTYTIQASIAGEQTRQLRFVKQ
jgi:hypothetical protein